MKIIGLTYIGERAEMVLKGDSSLLNGRKPMFTPDTTNDLRALPALILRISRLGKHIEPRFAGRYYDAIAPGVDFVQYDRLQEAQRDGKSWTEATCFDFSMAIGAWCDPAEKPAWTIDGKAWTADAMVCTPEEAIAQASRLMTIRQGDLVYISAQSTPAPLRREQVICATVGEQEKLYCKIK